MIAGTVPVVIRMITGRVKHNRANVGSGRRPIKSPRRATLLACEGSSRSVLNVLARIPGTGVVQYLRERICVLQVARLLIGGIEDC